MTSLDELGRTFNEDGILLAAADAPKKQPHEPRCSLCRKHGVHYGDHWIPEDLTQAERVGERLGDWLEEQGYASPALGELGAAAIAAVEAHR